MSQREAILREIAVEVDRGAKGIEAAIQIKRALLRSNVITQQQSNQTSLILLKANTLLKTVQQRASTYTEIDATAKQDLLKVVSDLAGALSEWEQKEIIPIKDESARAAFKSVLAIISVSVTALRITLGGT